jgi:hypothetical protein
MVSNLNKCCSELRKWADLAQWASDNSSDQFHWTTSSELVDTAKPYFRSQNRLLLEALKHSRRQFKPLCDPLEGDFGLHKWLSSEREETYSAWLCWIIEQFQDTQMLMALFGMRNDSLPKGLIRTRVEDWTEEGHKGKTGRVDIKITIHGQPILLLELKMGSADSADTEKQAGYSKSLPSFKHKVLLAESGDREEYPGGFKLRTWKSVCIEIRRGIAEVTKSNRINRAMALAFVGAVEQNIIGYPGRLRERIKLGQIIDSEILAHIQSGNL